jgi:polyhydroxybutyrate depolymerase
MACARRTTTGLAIVTVVTAAILMPDIVSAQRAETVIWTVDGETREATVYPPSKPPADGKVPLAFSFHGYGDNIQSFQHTNLHVAWPEAVVAYVQALPGRQGPTRWQVEKGQENDRDLRMIDAAIKSLRLRFPVDDTRIYATGFSNGGSFTYLLWAQRPAVFAAFAPVAAKLLPSVRPTPPGGPLFHIAGARDTTAAFADQQEAIKIASQVNGVADKLAPCGEGCTIYGGATASPVMAWIHSGGHEYPPTTAERIVKFFREHPRKP